MFIRQYRNVIGVINQLSKKNKSKRPSKNSNNKTLFNKWLECLYDFSHHYFSYIYQTFTVAHVAFLLLV